ncbi:MAG: carboxypeptidase regulatory-like domain-containing protein [Planctomycetes bacterium]|nr:carboxypeptidase regulatory-like domain-containing protein [Planctomycetota bacterium]
MINLLRPGFFAGLLLGLGLGLLATHFWWSPPPALATPDSDARPRGSSDGLPEPVRSESEPEPASVKQTAPAETRVATPEGWMPTAPLDRSCTLRGRVLTPDGVPAAGRSFACCARFGDHRVAEYVTTDAEARFRFVVRGVLPPDTPGTLTMEPGEPSHGITAYIPPAESLEHPLPHPLPAAEVTLGDLRLRVRPLIGAGLVVDEFGRGVVGARVEFRVQAPGGTGTRVGYTLRTTTDGVFRLHSETPPGAVELHVRAAGHVASGPLHIAPGRDDLRITLPRAGELRGVVEHPARLQPSIALTGSDGKRYTPTTWSGRIGDGVQRLRTKFSFSELPPGTATLSYGLPGQAPITLTVRVDPQASPDHPLLRGLELH